MNNLDQLRGDLATLENDVLPELKTMLADLIVPDYDPADNPDHEYRGRDIESLEAEIVEAEAEIMRLKKKLGGDK